MNILSGLTVIFIVLKVFGFINWSWWLVVLPTIIEVIIFGLLIYIFKKIFDTLNK